MNMRWIPVLALLAACELPTSRVVLQDTRTLDAADLAVLDLIQGSGDLRVEASTDGQITLEVKLTGPEREADDEEAKDSLVHVLEADGDTAFAEVWLDDPPMGYGLDTVLRMPAELAAVIEDGSGDLEIEGLGEVTLNDGSGDVALTGLTGPITVDDGSGDLVLSGCEGTLDIVDGSGDLVIEDHLGDARIEDGSGDIVLREVDGQVVIARDGSGDVISDNVRDLVLPGE